MGSKEEIESIAGRSRKWLSSKNLINTRLRAAAAAEIVLEPASQRGWRVQSSCLMCTG